ncbi:hypothetical protein L1987_31207 [Smallanthus sonchifolius]|uniref:Uncharacterized protein n=1 Tax=Smallanthus sonchifolius TaxID=185202 RepID=A0ACB9I4X7_9ASTR|nr:hypothetical protein L1987_31207 [Smallanthus sonchifolius]
MNNVDGLLYHEGAGFCPNPGTHTGIHLRHYPVSGQFGYKDPPKNKMQTHSIEMVITDETPYRQIVVYNYLTPTNPCHQPSQFNPSSVNFIISLRIRVFFRSDENENF